MSLRRRAYFTGNSLIEYALPLIVLFSAGLIMLLITNAPERLSKFFERGMNGSRSGDTVAVAPLGQLPAGSNLPGWYGAPGGEETAGNRGSKTIPPSVLPYGGEAELLPSETSGGMGLEIRPLASSAGLSDLAQELRESGADPALIDLVTRLANKGHEMASVQSSIPRKGDLTNAAQIMESIAKLKGEGGLKDEYNRQLGELRNYLANNPNALSHIPGGQSIIEGESGRIAAIIESLQADVKLNNLPNFGYFGYMPVPTGPITGEVTVTGGDAAGTQTSSNTVCQSGGNIGVCVHFGTSDNGGNNAGNSNQGGNGGG
jgi:hypothetical protein